MKIDFSMSGLNTSLFVVLLLLLEGVCVLILQNPFKNYRHFVLKDFIIFGIGLAAIAGGLVSLIQGIIQALPAMA